MTFSLQNSNIIDGLSWRHAARRAARWAAAGLMLTSCACSSLNGPNTAARRQAAGPEVSRAQMPEESAAGRPIARNVALSTYQRGQPTPSAEGAIQRISAEARMPLDCPPWPGGDGSCPPGFCPPGAPCAADCDDERFPDEYLCDGGDRDMPVHYSGDEMQGLDSEDTVTEFYDDEGRRRVKATNKVCIYAPRFAAVEVISTPLADVGGNRPLQSIVTDRGIALRGRETLYSQNQNEMPERLLTRQRGSTVRSADLPEIFDRPQALQGHVHSLTPLENYAFLQTGAITHAEGPWLARLVQGAVTLTRDQNPVITAVAEGTGELKSQFIPEETIGRENRPHRRLRIVKMTDTEVANQGDVVTFKIRFDNLGDFALRNVVIVDNLTPRLEYVDDSATCDRDGEFFTEDNGDGSLILKWVLDQPLPGRTGGVITFKARIR